MASESQSLKPTASPMQSRKVFSSFKNSCRGNETLWPGQIKYDTTVTFCTYKAKKDFDDELQRMENRVFFSLASPKATWKSWTSKLREPTDFRVCPQAYAIGK